MTGVSAPSAPYAPPPATGVRVAWSEVDEPVHAWVADTLGSPVATVEPQAGGFSPGAAARLLCRDGTRAFVKAVSTTANPDSPRMYRHEADVVEALPAHPALPRLLARYDDGAWVALLFADVEGRHPTLPWQADELDLVLGALTELHTAFDPNPVPDSPDMSQELAAMAGRWRELAAAPPSDLDSWHRDRLPELVELAEQPAPTGTSLVHMDLRADNILLTADGGVCLLDWANAGTGPAWLDPLFLLLEVQAYGGDDADLVLAAHPLTCDVDPAEVTYAVLAVAGMFERQSRRPPPPGLPTVRRFQRAYARVASAWLRRRLGG